MKKAPGWYPDPDADDRLRFWDGERFDDDAAPVVASKEELPAIDGTAERYSLRRERPWPLRILIGAVVVFALVLAASWIYLRVAPDGGKELTESPTEFTSPDGFSLTYPGIDEPLTGDRAPKDSSVLVTLSVEDNSAAVVWAVPVDNAAEVSEFTSAMATEVVAQFARVGSELSEPTATTLGGEPAWEITYESESASGPTENTAVTTFHDGKAFVVIGAKPAGSTASDANFDRLVETFRFTD